MKTMSQKAKIMWALVIGFIVGFGIAWLILNKPSSSVDREPLDTAMQEENGQDATQDTQATPDPSATTLNPVEEYVVHVADQPAGETPFVSRVELKEQGWVVLWDDNEGTPGRILGARRFNEGIHQGELYLANGYVTRPGETYHAVIHRDDGDRQFNYKIDTPIVGSNGEMVMMAFEVY